MQRSAATWLVQIMLAIGVFGPAALPGSLIRRLLQLAPAHIQEELAWHLDGRPRSEWLPAERFGGPDDQAARLVLNYPYM